MNSVRLGNEYWFKGKTRIKLNFFEKLKVYPFMGRLF